MECTETVSALPTERLEAELCSLAARVAAMTCESLLAVGEYDHRRGWQAWECRDMAGWLAWKCGTSPVTARFVRYSWDDDANLVGSFRLPAEDGAALVQARPARPGSGSSRWTSRSMATVIPVVPASPAEPSLPRFHLAVPVDDLSAARGFYGEVLGCPQGREASSWVDWDLFGHQVVTHLVERGDRVAGRNPVDGDDVPVPHFGLILGIRQFHDLAARLGAAGVEFVIPPHLRFAGQPGEQWTMFCLDPAGNALEFKAFADDAQVFRR